MTGRDLRPANHKRLLKRELLLATDNQAKCIQRRGLALKARPSWIMNLFEAASRIEQFRSGSLRSTVATLESKFNGTTRQSAIPLLNETCIGTEVLLAAIVIKRTSSQINEILHALGILLALPMILREGEIVESLSLAAGNTGKGFDLETNQRIAEFTFIQWQGGRDVIRQNKIFKDFYFLAEADTPKIRVLHTRKSFFAATEDYLEFLKEMPSWEKPFAPNTVASFPK